ncbi:hypothetical protein J4434_05655 [Candidatus Woesearchaeota archaeon]|nr:hypothetical protein [Candidatus Woesearchaeota archaeon]
MNTNTPDLKYIQITDLHKYDGPFLLITRTNFQYLPHGEIYQDLTSTAEFSRLYGIKQLGLVGSSCANACQDQTRGFHSDVTGAMMDIVLFRNHFSEHERKLGIAAGLYHDLAIMPCSDQGKLIRSGSYEEESLVEYLIKRSSNLKQRLKKHDVGIEELIDTIQGKGNVGKLLNSKEGIDVDNLSYLALDQVWMCGSIHSDDDRLKFREKSIFDQYNNLRFIDGDWVFDNPQLLVNLLKFRALMYKHTYHHQFNRAKEAFLIRVLREQKAQNITLDKMLKWNDESFNNWFERTFGPAKERLFFSISIEPFVEIGREYDLSKLEQLRRETENEEEGIIVEHLKPPRDAAKNLVLHNGEVKLLGEIPEFSDEIEKIQKIIRKLNYIGVYKKVEN